MSDYEYLSDDDDLVPIDNIPEFTVQEKQTPAQFLQNIQKTIQEKQTQEQLKEYQWEKLEEKAQQKIKQYTNQPDLFFSIIIATLDQTFKKVMGIEKTHIKLKRRKKTELQERQKNFLFNCIRQHFKEEPQSYEHDKKLYFSTLTTIFNKEGETFNITDEESTNLYKCQQCQQNLQINETLGRQTCPECGTEKDINPLLAEYITFSERDRFSTEAKDASKGILGFQLFMGGPMGFEFTKENIAKRMRDYLDTAGPFWTDEKIDKVVNTFKREAITMKEKNEVLKNNKLKEKAVELIEKERPEVYEEGSRESLNLKRELKLDISTKTEKNEEEELQRLNNAILTFNTGYFEDIENIEKFKKVKEILITNQIKGLSEPIVIKRTILTKPQMAAIFWKIKKTTQQEVANKFGIKSTKITEFINILQNPQEPMDKIFVKKIKRNKTVKEILLQ